jgi:UDP-galactopyranose mutase
VKTEIKLVEYTYPIPTVGLEEVTNKLRKVFEKNNIFLLGRNGNWEYINMDGVILNVDKFITEYISSYRKNPRINL